MLPFTIEELLGAFEVYNLAIWPMQVVAYVLGTAAVFLALVIKPRLSFACGRDVYAAVGLVFIAFAMIGYPVLGHLIDHRYPQSPPFGLTPCPLSVFTFGLLLLADSRVPKWVLSIPFLYAIGGILPVSIGVLEDLAMIVAGVVGSAMILYRDANRPATA